ncbi:MAG: hypothetical protein ACRKFN_11510 [Desulfitobacterium sp.]
MKKVFEKMKVTVLSERGREVLIRIEGHQVIGGVLYRTLRHEWWYDKEMMDKGIRSDEDGRVFCRGFAGAKEEEVLELFRNGGSR